MEERLAELRSARRHAAHELQLLTRSERIEQALGRLVREGAGRPDGVHAYADAFLDALARPVSQRCHLRALGRALHRLEPALESSARGDLAARIEEYRRRRISLEVAREALRAAARAAGLEALAVQTYLAPSPVPAGRA